MTSPITYIKGADIYTPDNVIRGGTVKIQHGTIAAIYGTNELIELREGETVVDARGLRLVPGFVDVHVHGGGGYEGMNGKEDIYGMCRYHAAHGTTSLLVTTLTDQPERLRSAVSAAREAMEDPGDGAQVWGVHLEGPFLNVTRTGAQNPAHLRAPNLDELQQLCELSGNAVRLITIAPELEHAEACIRWAANRGITVSVGHSDAGYETMQEAIAWGASHVTHLFNGMRPLHHREPGVAGAALMRDELTVELICDGHHVHRELIPWVMAVKPKHKVVCITDCMAAAGLPDGDYALGDLPVRSVSGQVHLLKEDGTLGNLAGSVLTMLDALRMVVSVTDMSLSDALPYFTINPARQAGADRVKGSIEPGKDADFLLLDDKLDLSATYVKGRKVYERAT